MGVIGRPLDPVSPTPFTSGGNVVVGAKVPYTAMDVAQLSSEAFYYDVDQLTCFLKQEQITE